jgi:hypothetical protein
MTRWTMMMVLAALAGCAGASTTTRQRDFASGHWVGEIERNGSFQPLSLDIERENGVYRGEWQSVAGVRSRPLENVDVQGDEVRFETDKLRFLGHLSGSTLSGTVTDKPADATFGEFSVTSEEGVVHPAESEWSPEVIPAR